MTIQWQCQHDPRELCPECCIHEEIERGVCLYCGFDLAWEEKCKQADYARKDSMFD